MGQINIYKIDSSKCIKFNKEMNRKLELINIINLKKVNNGKEINFEISFFLSKATEEKDVKWNWLLKEFKEEEIKINGQPKAVLVIKKECEVYAISFGSAYFIVDKYSDKYFAFNFARKIKYKEIKTTALTSPNAKRNKMINTYLNYENLEFDSGESFTKIKAKMELDEDFNLHNETIEVGNSIKFTLKKPSLENVIELIIYIENIIKNNEDKYKIPVFYKVVDKSLIEYLDKKLESDLSDDIEALNISEIEIIGATEVFNNNDDLFKLCFDRYSEEISHLSIEELKRFSQKYKFNLNEKILEIKVVKYVDGKPVITERIKDLIDYTNDEKRCILIKGQWYYFNEDYLEYLVDSINEIDVVYNKKYDLRKSNQREFWDKKYLEEKDLPEYEGKKEQEIRKSIKNKYYTERYYNIMLSEEFKFENYDRQESKVGTSNIELMDLYKDRTLFSVKIGKSSAKLCYVIDQSLQALKVYKHSLVEHKPEVDNFALWIVLERENKLELVDRKPDINKLDMLVLKNKIDSWKKEVRVLGYKPVIYINYVIKD